MLSPKEICDKYKVEPFPSGNFEKLGIAIETIGKLPINGVRHQPAKGTCGWYIWCGEELSDEPDFFKPLHVNHIKKYLPEVEKYLSLPPEYRFLVAGEQEDVWHDSSLTGM